ncbi:MAG TPA: hypothetical protein VMH39_01185, partial [Gemmatimonadaceae bacterium]|nr:hypothetical protein [Gemmatimonadaceae bacterium]
LESNNGTTIYFANGDELWGPVWSNDTININTTGAKFHDVVATAKTIKGTAYGTFAKGYQINQKAITLPSTATLATLSGLATTGGFNFTPPTTGDETTVRTRIQFVATDINGFGDSTAANDGFFRVYTAISGQVGWLRGDWPATPSNTNLLNCGDWLPVTAGGPLKFFPVVVHGTAWFRTLALAGGMTEATFQSKDSLKASASSWSTIMQNPTAQCFPGGDPHLVAIARLASPGYTTALAGYTVAQGEKGGDDTTFTPTDPYGAWTLYSNTPNAAVSAKRGDAKYLFPLYRGYNTNTKGVIYAGGTVAVSGVVGGQVTLYSPNTIVIIDDLRYAVDPALGTCTDVLGLISGANTIVADNALNTPDTVKTTNPKVVRSLDDTKDLYIHGVIMALGTSFQVQNYAAGPTSTNNCGAVVNGRGCLYLTGGLIQNNRGAVGTSSGTGYAKEYTYDRCAATNPPPYFPTTGVFTDNKYYELDPVNFSIATLFANLVPH